MTIHLSEQQLGLTFDSAKEPEPEGGDGFHLFSIHNDRTVDLCLSTTTSLVLRTVSERDRSSASALYAVSPPSEMSPTTVASSVYMMMTVVGWVGVQLVAEYVALWDQVLSDSGGGSEGKQYMCTEHILHVLYRSGVLPAGKLS